MTETMRKTVANITKLCNVATKIRPYTNHREDLTEIISMMHYESKIESVISWITGYDNTEPLKEGQTETFTLPSGDTVTIEQPKTVPEFTVHKNYAEFIRLDKETKAEKKTFSDLEVKKLFDNDQIEWVDSILVMIYTGMRIQEMLNLTRFDVDLDKMLIKGGLKTDAGKDRVIPIHPKIQKYLRERCKSDKLFPVKQNHYRDGIYYPILERLGIERKTPHSCRHTFATLLARAQVDTLAIEQLMGHTDYAFTANVYTHTDVDFLTSAIQKV